MSNPESIFPKGSIAYENEQKQNPSSNSEAEAETFFPKTSIAYQNEVKTNRISPALVKVSFLH